MFAMWFSGLRGGVAFALASVSYAAKDFAASCGGIDPAQAALDPTCTDMTDSLAILQTTLIIASFTIFVFGGAITDLAICLKVLDKGSRLTDSPAHPPTHSTRSTRARAPPPRPCMHAAAQSRFAPRGRVQTRWPSPRPPAPSHSALADSHSQRASATTTRCPRRAGPRRLPWR